MRSTLLTLFSLAIAIPCASQVPDDPQYVGSLIVPAYYGGYILDWDGPMHTKVTVYNSDTKPAYSAPSHGPGDIRYLVWAIDPDGTGARAYQVRVPHDLEGRIDLLDSAGQPTLTVKTGSYLPQRLAFAPDHTLWTVGYNDGYERREENFPVIHHYARTGEALGKALPWSQIAGEVNAYTALQLIVGGRWLFASNDRLGFIMLHSGYWTWIEVGYGGNLLGTYDLSRNGELNEPIAITASNGVYARIWKDKRFNGWAVLDRAKGSWRRVTGFPKGRIIGSEGDNLIFARQDEGWTVLHSVSPGSLQTEKPEE